MRPTEEQLGCLTDFALGESMAIEAGAGTGKTSTLRLLAYSTKRRGRYLAFNKAIVTDVGGRLPERCQASTAHSLAFRAVGRRYSHRLNGARMKSWDIARRLDIARVQIRYGSQTKWLTEDYLGGLTMRAVTRFCQSADTEPGPQHFPYIDGIDLPDKDGKQTWENNDAVRDLLIPAMRTAWADLQSKDGYLRFGHEHYLKLWQLEGPHIPVDYILFDEAQDANPVMAAIVGAQEHAQRVYVGDACQAIYEFTGAINAMEAMAGRRCFLTQSFRFGPAIAARANEVLERLDAALRVKGLDSINSTVGVLEQPAAILCRTNAIAVQKMLAWQDRGIRPHLVGGGREVAAFARAAGDLQAGKLTGHPELACFGSWGEVEEYVQSDTQGDELKLLVDLINEYGVPKVLKALEEMPDEADAGIIVSTAHKSKGREWSTVQLAEDFAMVDETQAELRLRYVAFTRARQVLDDSVLKEQLTKKVTTDGPA